MHAIEMQRRKRRRAASVVALVGAAAVTAFPAASTAGAKAQATPSPACDKGTITKAVAAAGKAQNVTAKLIHKQFKCAKSWAYADASVGKGSESIAVVFIFKASGTTWTLKNRAKVCKAPGNQVPAAIYKLACTTS